MPPTRAFFRNFGGGINNNTPANQIKDNELVEALNVEFDKHNNIRSRLGVRKFNPNRNLLTRTEELDHADWIAYDGTSSRAANFANGPDNQTTADRLSDTDVGVISTIGQSKSCSNNQIFTFSIYVKSDQHTDGYPGIGIRFLGGGTPIEAAIQIGQNGDVFDTYGQYLLRSNSVGFISATIEPINSSGNRIADSQPSAIMYFRVSITVQNNASGNNIVRPVIYPCTIPTFNGVWGNPGFIGGRIFWGAQLERGKKLTTYQKNVASASSALDILSKFTSIYQFNKEDGSSGIFATSGNKIYRYDPATTELVDASGGLTLPNDTYWQWVTWRDIAIGVNRANTASGATNPVKITSATGNAAALGGTPPKGLYIEVWNDRIWIVNADDTSSVKCSSLGLPENYTNTGKAGSQAFEFGMEITGIKAHRDRLFVFGKDTIQYIQAGSPNTDLEQYEIKTFSSKVGCVSAYSIQSVLDDLIFLSYYGITSLAAVEQYGDFESSILSKNLEDFDDPEHFSFFGDTCASAILSTKSQYILSVPLGVNSVHTKTYSFDFTGIQEKTVGFTELDSVYLAPCFAEVLLNNKKRLLIGGYSDPNNDNLAFIYIADEPNVFDDDGVNYTKRIRTKAHDLEALTSSKVFYRIFFDFSLFSDDVMIDISYRLDEKEELEKTWSIYMTANIVDGAKYDVDKYDEGKFAVLATPFKTIQRRLVGPPGRIGQSLQLTVGCSEPHGYILRGYGFDAQLVTSRRLTGG